MRLLERACAKKELTVVEARYNGSMGPREAGREELVRRSEIPTEQQQSLGEGNPTTVTEVATVTSEKTPKGDLVRLRL